SRSIRNTSTSAFWPSSHSARYPGGVGSSCWRMSALNFFTSPLAGEVGGAAAGWGEPNPAFGSSNRPRLELALKLPRDLFQRGGVTRHHLRELCIGAGERRSEKALVAGEPVARRHRGVGDEPVVERDIVHPACRPQLRRQERLAVSWIDVLDAQQIAVTADLVHERNVLERRGQLVAQTRTALAHSLGQTFLLQCR